jgi:hypothetical protein
VASHEPDYRPFAGRVSNAAGRPPRTRDRARGSRDTGTSKGAPAGPVGAGASLIP